LQPTAVIDTMLKPPAGIFELAELERRYWRERLDALYAAGVPLNAEDDADDDADDEDADDDADDTKRKARKSDDDDDDDGKRKTRKSDDDDDDAGELEKARRAAAAANRELRRIKAEREESETAAKKEAGKYKELYEEATAKLEKLEADVERGTKERLVTAALSAANARNPARAARLLDLDDIDDASDAERAVKKLLKSDPYLFDGKPTRQKRGGGADDEDDDDRDDRRNDRDRPRRPRNRLRAGLEATAPK